MKLKLVSLCDEALQMITLRRGASLKQVPNWGLCGSVILIISTLDPQSSCLKPVVDVMLTTFRLRTPACILSLVASTQHLHSANIVRLSAAPVSPIGY